MEVKPRGRIAAVKGSIGKVKAVANQSGAGILATAIAAAAGEGGAVKEAGRRMLPSKGWRGV